MLLKSYDEAAQLQRNLQRLKNLQYLENIFLDYSAQTKGFLGKAFKFKIFFKYQRSRPRCLMPEIFMKNILQKTAVESTGDIKHVLATLLRSLARYLKILDYHGSINPQTITAVATISKQEQKEHLSCKKVGLPRSRSRTSTST